MISLGFGSLCKRFLAVMNVLNIRNRLRPVFDHSLAHVQNAFFVLTTKVSVQEAQTPSVRKIALRLRTALAEQTDEGRLHVLVRIQRALMQAADQPVLFVKSSSILLHCFKRRKVRFVNAVDFSPAVIQRRYGGPRTWPQGREAHLLFI